MHSLTPTPILLVSYHTALVRSVSQPLASAGYRVIHMTSGAAVLQHVQVHPPELVMAHMSPGGTEEVQLCQRLKHDLLTAPVPVVLLIDSSEEAALIVGLAMGVDDYLI